jgi:hypothetical protein
VVKQHRRLASRGRHRFGVAHARGQPALESPKCRTGLPHIDRAQPKDFRGAIGGTSRFGAEHLTPRYLVARRQPEPRREMLLRRPPTHVHAALAHELQGCVRAEPVELAQIGTQHRK